MAQTITLSSKARSWLLSTSTFTKFTWSFVALIRQKEQPRKPQGSEFGSHHLAGTAPRGGEIHNAGLVSLWIIINTDTTPSSDCGTCPSLRCKSPCPGLPIIQERKLLPEAKPR